MIRCWLVPGKKLNIELLYAVDFKLPDISDEAYTLSEIIVQIDTQKDLEEIQRNLPIIETEIKLGIASAYHARRILEIKGLSVDEKNAMIQERMSSLVKQMPDHFDYDLFTEMQYVMVTCRDDFKSIRNPTHLSRIISIHYLFRKSLRELGWKF